MKEKLISIRSTAGKDVIQYKMYSRPCLGQKG